MSRKCQKKHEVVYEELRGRIVSGALAPCDRLPAEKDLAAQFGVAAMTLRQALKRLTEEGYLIRRPYHGTIVAPQEHHRSSSEPQSFRIGLVVPFDLLTLSHPIYSRLLNGVEGVTSEMNSRIEFVVSNPANPEAERLFLKTISEGSVDGWILPSVISPAVRKALRGTSVPKVLLHFPDEALSGHFFGSDSASTANQIAAHLLQGGYSRVLSFAPKEVFRFREHYAVRLRELLEAEGGALSVRELSGWSAEAGAAMCRKCLDEGERFDAVVCDDDEIAFGVMQALRERGLSIPEIGVIGMGNFPAGALVDPPLTTIALPFQQVGREITRLLFDLLLQRPVEPAYRKFLPKLMPRASTHRPAELALR